MRKLALVGIGLAVLLAGWRPAPREPEGIALVRALGVDGGGPVVLTAVCGGEDQENPSRGSCAGEDFNGALAALRMVLRGAACPVWGGAVGAASLLAACGDPASALELMERRGVEAPTVVEALAALRAGEELCLPLLAGEEDGPWLLDWEEWRGAV